MVAGTNRYGQKNSGAENLLCEGTVHCEEETVLECIAAHASANKEATKVTYTFTAPPQPIPQSPPGWQYVPHRRRRDVRKLSGLELWIIAESQFFFFRFFWLPRSQFGLHASWIIAGVVALLMLMVVGRNTQHRFFNKAERSPAFSLVRIPMQ